MSRLTLCNPVDCSKPGSSVLHSLLEFAQIHVQRVDDAIQPSHPLPSPYLLPSILPSIRVFSNELALHITWAKYRNFGNSPFNKYSGWISFRIDWFDLLAVKGNFKSLIQHHNSKASVLWCSAFFMAQLSHPYMTIGKPIVFTRWIFAIKVTSLLFNMLSRLVIAFLPRSKHLFMAAVTVHCDFGAQENLSLLPLFLHLLAMKWWGQMPWSLFFNGDF